MKIIIIANSPQFYTVRRLFEEIEAYGHTAQFITPKELSTSLAPSIVLNRCSGISYDDSDLDTLSKIRGALVSNDIEHTRIFRDKWLQFNYFQKYGIPTIPSFELGTSTNRSNIPESMHGYLFKPKRSNQTKGIIKTENINYQTKDQRYIIQPLLEKKAEYRVLIAFGEVLGILKKNHSDPFELLNCEKSHLEYLEYAQATTGFKHLIEKIMPHGPHFYGLDILEDVHGDHLLIELNNVPGFEYFEKISHVNVAKSYLQGLLNKFNDLCS
ncbi:RimK family alpha-L-glutamate ligase [Bacteriovorax sp. Seq25_V]|uniref:ATP-grasp domain-containing protein n=1 Tax=Bacteriovorax sp. Seq25_V TaxID=1201288 RepID=UPI000389E76D|nr:hypothetical protein [Bacteriovorax sp. Seq25_V]EQC46218.1 hypothetical protein M900_1555 [Bacteriovorax sp. Seq25_V]